jgi:hypothetical protein
VHRMSSFAISVIAVCIATLAAASPAEPPKRPGPQGDTWDSIKKLPNWNGAWTLDEASFRRQLAASGGPDGDPDIPPLTPKWAALRKANGAANNGQGPEGKGVETNSTHCLPDGMPGMMVAPFSFEFLLTPGRVTIVSEDGEVRRVYTDGRPHPADLDPTFAGHSIGHWEDGTLVVDTSGMLPQAQLFVGLHVTAQTRVTERIFKTDAHTMRIDTAVTDSAMFTRPYRYTRTYKLNDAGMVEYVCEQNNRDSNGVIDLTPPPPQ